VEAKILLAAGSASELADAIARSDLVPPEELSAALTHSGDDKQALAQHLLGNKLLTRFQLITLSQGQGQILRIGNYEILDRLGAGGMGTVYKARHRRMKRIVALKVLASAYSANPVYVKRFQREVETIASLGHPNIVMAYDADEAEVGHFLVMEFVDGRDLALCVEQEGAFSLQRAIDCILQTARGLAYAHAQDIIHRDIKPHNLLLDSQGVVKITDLGLARLSRDAEVQALTEVTMAGGVIGTVDYMSPEQAVDSTTLDHRCDIYSLGCTLYYLLTGEPPYRGSTVMAILLKHRDAPIPSLTEVVPSAPAALQKLLERMLAKQADERIQQMSEVVSELEAIAAQLDPSAASEAGGRTIDMGSFSAASTSTSVGGLTLDVASASSPTTALIVEPSRSQAAIIKGFLHDHAIEVVSTVASGKDAIATVHALRPRVVISTMHLPDVNGVALAEQIRAEIKVNAPGFVLITSEADGTASSELKKLSRVELLVKPFTAEQLLETLSRVIGSTVALEAPPRPSRADLRVLIVDDSSTARLRVRSVLQELGFRQFLEDPDGAHAIVTAARESCDLIVTDYNMPLMDGRALVSYLKQNPATAAIPIVMVTTETEPRVLDPVRKLGVVAVIEKAFPAAVVGPLLDSLF
jgi:serine/threonine protein kinase